MTDTATLPPLGRPDLTIATDGEFAGWRTWTRDTFESNNGPFWHRFEDDGKVRCAFRVEPKHLNGLRGVHGGCFMTFADYALFAIAAHELQGPAVTVAFGCEFLDAAYEGELVEATGEVTRAGKSLIFVRGIIRSAGRPLFTFSGTIKRVKRKVPPSEVGDGH
ncbi:PaaI family thioesterase [Rhodopseudomonas palustris]|uniref:Thioesterase superfamily n=1 Tax=Rhodopseudomonas palustris (strain BisB18) TaxID=316056 RepID=Q218N4_RHOPB